MAQLSVSWSNHLKNIGNGLSSLQQNSEFVDMTLAADGHYVKVHQLVMAISSPYIKNLIAAAACAHPVIYLNKISHSTLCSILEYIYTGEVTVALDNISSVLETAKELHIKGLEDMDLTQLLGKSKHNDSTTSNISAAHENTFDDTNKNENTEYNAPMSPKMVMESDVDISEEPKSYFVSKTESKTVSEDDLRKISKLGNRPLQYTVSNRGSIQLILNRFIYYLKYTNKKKTNRQWRCVEYVNHYKCPATIVTQDDVVVKRIAAHSHPFHDRRIMKKLTSGTVFSELTEAESEGEKLKVTTKRSK